jgi:hypothetical protein
VEQMAASEGHNIMVFSLTTGELLHIFHVRALWRGGGVFFYLLMCLFVWWFVGWGVGDCLNWHA